MSIIQQAPLWYPEDLRPGQLVVALALADFADDAGRCYPALRTIGIKCGYSRRQASRIVKELRALGYVTIEVEATARTSPIYQLHPNALKTTPKRQRRQHDTPPPEGHLVTSEVTDDASRGDTDDTPGVTPVSPSPSVTHQDPSEIPLKEEIEHEQLTIVETDDDTIVVASRPRNLGWDAISEVFGYEPDPGSQDEGLWKLVAAKANREDNPGDEVRVRATRLIANWGAKTLTPGSLNKWWSRFGTPLGAASEEEALKLKDELARTIQRRRAAEIDKADSVVDASVVDASDLPPVASGETWEEKTTREAAELLDAIDEVGDEEVGDEASG